VDLNERFGNQLQWFVPSGLAGWMASRGIERDNIHEMVWWEEKRHPVTNDTVRFLQYQLFLTTF
jgi:hypothetical protein